VHLHQSRSVAARGRARAVGALPHSFSDSAICVGPTRPNAVHTLVAGEEPAAVLDLRQQFAKQSLAAAYIGDESIMPPPASKNACSTCSRRVRSTTSSPTSKVSQCRAQPY